MLGRRENVQATAGLESCRVASDNHISHHLCLCLCLCARASVREKATGTSLVYMYMLCMYNYVFALPQSSFSKYVPTFRALCLPPPTPSLSAVSSLLSLCSPMGVTWNPNRCFLIKWTPVYRRPSCRDTMFNRDGFLFFVLPLSAALCRFIPRHADELELDVDDPLYVEEEEDDYWYRGYNMRTGERGIFPAFYAHEVIGQSKELLGELRDTSTVFSSVSLWMSEESRALYVCVHITTSRNEKKSSMDWDFQRSVFGVCWGTLSPRQRHSLRRHAEGKLSGKTAKHTRNHTKHTQACAVCCTV